VLEWGGELFFLGVVWVFSREGQPSSRGGVSAGGWFDNVCSSGRGRRGFMEELVPVAGSFSGLDVEARILDEFA
jgi:hypothetical protein